MSTDLHKLYKCLRCDNEEIVPPSDLRIDGRVCKACGEHSMCVGFAGVDLSRGKDFTAERLVRVP